MKKKHVVAQEKNITVETGEISSKEIGDRLLEGEFIILGIETVGGIKHAILLYAYENGFVSVIDPLVGQLKETLDDILKCARMDVGTWYISAFRR
jgi:hypothetical protein